MLQVLPENPHFWHISPSLRNEANLAVSISEEVHA